MASLTLLDTTMRDGEQSPGIVFNKSDKIKIARLLVACGIQEAEIGTPAMGKEEMDTISALVEKNFPLRLFTWNRAVKKDIDMSIACGISNLFISSPVSDMQIMNKLGKNRAWVVANLMDIVHYAKSKQCQVAFGMEDASRADISFLIHLITALESIGVERIRFSDTIGILTPAHVYKIITQIKKETNLPIEMHAHNDFGLAAANAMSAFTAGATIIDTTLMGIGERAGNTSLDELTVGLKVLYQTDTGIDLPKMKKVTKIFARMIHEPISKWRPILGENAFSHESGIHVDGVIKNPSNYEPYPPELVGSKRKFIIGKHSGRKAIEHKYEQLGIRLSERELEELSETIRQKALHLKRSLQNKELIEIWENNKLNTKDISNELKSN